MATYPFNKSGELKDIGMRPAIKGMYGMPSFPSRKINTPITPKENWARICNGEKPLWIPNVTIDFNAIQPEIMPDALARNKGGFDWFGIDWEYEPLSNAAMVRPGTRRLSDITKWEEEIIWPDLSAIDWQKDYEENYKDSLSPDRPTMFVIVNGFYERLADLTSFEDTLCAFLEEPEAVEAFYTRLCDWHIELIKIAKEVYDADVITFHDDMGTQRSSFFSPALFAEVMLPHYQRMNAAAHEMGLIMNFHSCGSVANQIGNFIAAGFDFWEGQDACNDKFAIAAEYGDRLGQTAFMMPSPDSAEEDIKANIIRRIKEIGKYGKYMVFLGGNPQSSFNAAEFMYEMSRRYYLGEEI